jgi:hypothetical protein
MLLCTFYIDAFEHSRSWSASTVGIYMSFANASKEELLSAESRYLLCLAPKEVDIFEVVRTVIVEPMRLFEHGFKVSCFFAPLVL